MPENEELNVLKERIAKLERLVEAMAWYIDNNIDGWCPKADTVP